MEVKPEEPTTPGRLSCDFHAGGGYIPAPARDTAAADPPNRHRPPAPRLQTTPLRQRHRPALRQVTPPRILQRHLPRPLPPRTSAGQDHTPRSPAPCPPIRHRRRSAARPALRPRQSASGRPGQLSGPRRPGPGTGINPYRHARRTGTRPGPSHSPSHPGQARRQPAAPRSPAGEPRAVIPGMRGQRTPTSATGVVAMILPSTMLPPCMASNRGGVPVQLEVDRCERNHPRLARRSARVPWRHQRSVPSGPRPVEPGTGRYAYDWTINLLISATSATAPATTASNAMSRTV
jgi:hypothetical protein